MYDMWGPTPKLIPDNLLDKQLKYPDRLGPHTVSLTVSTLCTQSWVPVAISIK